MRLVDAIELERPQTKAIVAMLKALDLQGRNLLVYDLADKDKADLLWKSARNIDGLTLLTAKDVNAYELLKPECVLFTQSAFEAVLEALGS